jgi:hypothetical protein
MIPLNGSRVHPWPVTFVESALDEILKGSRIPRAIKLSGSGRRVEFYRGRQDEWPRDHFSHKGIEEAFGS